MNFSRCFPHQSNKTLGSHYFWLPVHNDEYFSGHLINIGMRNQRTFLELNLKLKDHNQNCRRGILADMAFGSSLFAAIMNSGRRWSASI